ncbi:MAG: S41 family peptidase [bacterium]|nr:S41 family peptidase [bacterium]MDY4184633.1 S41 family peptidase [Sodaliphilus sp.]
MKKSLLLAFAVMLTLGAIAERIPSSISKLLNAEYAIKSCYVDSVDENKLVEDAIIGMLEKLDPHSQFTTAKETQELEEPLQGEFSGIGIQFNLKQDTLYVIQTIPNGPSERVGMLPGDRIIYVNDTTIAGVKIKNTDIQKKLRGKKGTKVTVKVKRGTHPELITFVITRDKIPLHSVDAAYMLDEKTGYIKISSFGAKTYNEMIDKLHLLKKQGMRQLVVDLSDNGGGYMDAAIQMVNEFLDDEQLIVYTEGLNQSRAEAKANGRGEFKDMKLVVIMSQYSASASEIFAGAIQDWDRGLVLGRRSFGKGLVQRPFKFEDGSMMRLTVARYHTPSGRCIQKPYVKGDKKGYDADLLTRYNAGEYYNIDSIQFNDSLKYTSLKNHRVVYGGGGIMPDVFVPVDTTEYSKYYRDMLAKGVIYQFALDYVDKNRKALKSSYPNVEKFDQFFSLSDDDMQAFIAAGEKEKVAFNEEQYATSKEVFKCYLKGLIARDLYTEDNAFNIIVNHRNRDLQEALRLINDTSRYQSLLLTGNTEYEKIAARHKAAAQKSTNK